MDHIKTALNYRELPDAHRKVTAFPAALNA
jgi:hypothetical protein